MAGVHKAYTICAYYESKYNDFGKEMLALNDGEKLKVDGKASLQYGESTECDQGDGELKYVHFYFGISPNSPQPKSAHPKSPGPKSPQSKSPQFKIHLGLGSESPGSESPGPKSAPICNILCFSILMCNTLSFTPYPFHP